MDKYDQSYHWYCLQELESFIFTSSSNIFLTLNNSWRRSFYWRTIIVPLCMKEIHSFLITKEQTNDFSNITEPLETEASPWQHDDLSWAMFAVWDDLRHMSRDILNFNDIPPKSKTNIKYLNYNEHAKNSKCGKFETSTVQASKLCSFRKDLLMLKSNNSKPKPINSSSIEAANLVVLS